MSHSLAMHPALGLVLMLAAGGCVTSAEPRFAPDPFDPNAPSNRCDGWDGEEPQPDERPEDGAPTVGSSSELRVVNESDRAVRRLFVSSSAAGAWGPDQLGSDDIGPGESFRLSEIIPCGVRYDLRGEGSDGEVLAERFGVLLPCGETITWTLSDG